MGSAVKGDIRKTAEARFPRVSRLLPAEFPSHPRRISHLYIKL